MKKLILWVIIAWSILLLGCSNTSNESDVKNQIVFKWTLKDALKKNQSAICSFTFEDENTQENWIIYIKKWKAKSITNVELKNEKMNIEAYVIIKNDYIYTRSNIQNNQWAKFENLYENNQKQYKEDPIWIKELQLICENNEVDENLFNIPSEISFIDITDYLINK